MIILLTIFQVFMLFFAGIFIISLTSNLFHVVLKMCSGKTEHEKIRWIGALKLSNHQEPLADKCAKIYTGKWKKYSKIVCIDVSGLFLVIIVYISSRYLGAYGSLNVLIGTIFAMSLFSIWVIEIRWNEVLSTLENRTEKHIIESGERAVEEQRTV